LQLLWDCDVLSTNLFEAPPAGKLGKMLSVQGAPSGAMRHLNTAFTVSPTEELHDAWIPPLSRQSARQIANNHGKDATLAMVGGRCANEFAESRFAPLSNPRPASRPRFFVLPQGRDRLQSRILGPSTAEIAAELATSPSSRTLL
jgi:hypothetical protein